MPVELDITSLEKAVASLEAALARQERTTERNFHRSWRPSPGSASMPPVIIPPEGAPSSTLRTPNMIRYKTDPKLAEQSSTPPQPAESTPDVEQGPPRRDAEGQMALDIPEGPEEPAIKAPRARRPRDAR